MSHKFDVGDELVHKDSKTETVFLVTDIARGRYTLTQNGHHQGRPTFADLERVLRLKTPANPNLVEVSSLDYSDSKLLDDDDVAIITKHLNSLENY
jgi:hypothetical protein